jgi:flagellum-specific peptidoglycan hydrolase FlgJ
MSLDQEIYNTAIAEGFSPTSAKLIVAQARLESSNYTSNVFNNNNNMYGMKFVGQPLATKGTLAPPSERSKSCLQGGECKNSDYYAKYKSPSDSAKDTIQRLYKKTRNGIGFNELKDVKDATEFANKLKQRGYFGATASSYALGLNARLLLISISEVYDKGVELYQENKKKINYALLGVGILLVTIGAYYFYKRK